MTHIHEIARVGFEAEAESYDRGRPDYPSLAIRSLIAGLGVDETTTVVDLAAGTGRFTGLLAPYTKVVGVEPVAAMRTIFGRRFPDIPLLEGTAEAIPLPDGYANVVTAAQAFHWFDGQAALREIHRVLRPFGTLGLIWNVRDEACPWVHQLMELIRPYHGHTPAYSSGDWKTAFENKNLFAPLGHKQFTHVQVCAISDIVDHVASISYVAALEASVRKGVLEEISARLISCHGAGPVEFPYRTDIWMYVRS